MLTRPCVESFEPRRRPTCGRVRGRDARRRRHRAARGRPGAVVDGLGLEQAGIAHDEAGVVVDEHLRTTVPHVFSVGDVVGGMMFTHVATYQAPQAIANMLDGEARQPDYRTMPRATFTDPVLAAVGLTEDAAREAGYDVEVRRSDVGARGKARAIGDRRGRVKFVLDRATGAILGVGIPARDGADLSPGPQVAMNAPGGTSPRSSRRCTRTRRSARRSRSPRAGG